MGRRRDPRVRSPRPPVAPPAPPRPPVAPPAPPPAPAARRRATRARRARAPPPAGRTVGRRRAVVRAARAAHAPLGGVVARVRAGGHSRQRRAGREDRGAAHARTRARRRPSRHGRARRHRRRAERADGVRDADVTVAGRTGTKRAHDRSPPRRFRNARDRTARRERVSTWTSRSRSPRRCISSARWWQKRVVPALAEQAAVRVHEQPARQVSA